MALSEAARASPDRAGSCDGRVCPLIKRDVATRDPQDYNQLLVPIAEFTRLVSVEFFKAFDGVCQVSAVVVGELLHGGRMYWWPKDLV